MSSNLCISQEYQSSFHIHNAYLWRSPKSCSNAPMTKGYKWELCHFDQQPKEEEKQNLFDIDSSLNFQFGLLSFSISQCAQKQQQKLTPLVTNLSGKLLKSKQLYLWWWFWSISFVISLHHNINSKEHKWSVKHVCF